MSGDQTARQRRRQQPSPDGAAADDAAASAAILTDLEGDGSKNKRSSGVHGASALTKALFVTLLLVFALLLTLFYVDYRHGMAEKAYRRNVNKEVSIDQSIKVTDFYLCID